MRIGLSTYDIAAHDLVELARAADEAGFESLWLGEHVVLPLGYGSEHPTTSSSETVQHHTKPIIDPSTILVDPLIVLGGAAVATAEIRLATGIYLLPLRHPILIARAIATLHDLTRGRFVLGSGSGWLGEEFDALEIPFDQRGSRFDETIDALRALCSGEEVRHSGKHFTFGPVVLGPEAVDVPIVLGGNSERALRRVASKADGWFSSGTPSFDEARALRDRIDWHCVQAGRARSLPLWFRTSTPDGATLARYRDEDFDQMVVWADQLWPREGDLDHKRSCFTAAVERFGLDEFSVATAGSETRQSSAGQRRGSTL